MLIRFTFNLMCFSRDSDSEVLLWLTVTIWVVVRVQLRGRELISGDSAGQSSSSYKSALNRIEPIGRPSRGIESVDRPSNCSGRNENPSLFRYGGLQTFLLCSAINVDPLSSRCTIVAGQVFKYGKERVSRRVCHHGSTLNIPQV